jgi:hypothetical protein
MDCIYRILFRIYYFFTNITFLCRQSLISYHLVGPDGTQYPLTEHNLQQYDHLLVIYYDTVGTRYRFHPIFKTLGWCTVSLLTSAYKSFKEPKNNKLFAVNASIQDHVYTINAIEFNVVGNQIFTPIFNLWLCTNYLHITPSEHVEISYIDDTTSICCTKGPIHFHEDGVKIEK